MYFKTGVLKRFAKFTEKHVTFYDTTLSKSDSSTGVFLTILRIFYEYLF